MRIIRLRSLFAAIWIANIVVCLISAGLFSWFQFHNDKVEVSSKISLTATIKPRVIISLPTITAVPPPIRRPTITPWPTLLPGASVTPFLFSPSNSQIIGYSIEKRPQQVFQFGQGPFKKLIVAGIHGGSEWNTIQLADQLISYLKSNSDHVPSDTTIFILRDINPDGTARSLGVDGRVNANGVDLNHNWPYNWKPDWPRDGCWTWRKVTGGQSAGSEAEVQNLIKFIDKIKPAALISYHSAALGIFPGGKPEFAPSVKLASAISEVSDYPYPPIDTGCDYSGNLTDWAANTRGIPAIDIELTNHQDIDFDQNLRILQVFLDWKR